jgi:hypothetical protein
MSHLSQNLERLIQMISIEQLLGLVKQNNTSADILTTPIVQKVVKAYEDELQTLNSVTNPNSCVKDYSEDIAKIHEQLASINSNLLHLAEAIKNIHISTNVDKSSSKAEDKSSSKAEEEEHVRLKIEEKQVTTTNELDDSDDDESSVLSDAKDLEEEESEKEVSDEASVESSSEAEEVESETEVADEVADEEADEEADEVADEEEEESEKEVSDEEEEEVASVASEVEEQEEEEEEQEEEEEVFEIEIDDVTYYATSEENGILYEVDKDGEVGKKVGIIKDGEPIFS